MSTLDPGAAVPIPIPVAFTTRPLLATLRREAMEKLVVVADVPVAVVKINELSVVELMAQRLLVVVRPET